MSGSSVAFPFRSPADLRAYSVDHLYYELTMLYGTAMAIERRRHLLLAESITPDPLGRILTNAVIESFATHARGLALFLYPEATTAKYKNTVTADEYMKDSVEWRDHRGALPPLLRTVIDRTGKEIAHLTIDRLPMGSSDKGWNPDAILQTFSHPFRAFTRDAISPDRLDVSVVNLLDSLLASPRLGVAGLRATTNLTTEPPSVVTDLSTKSPARYIGGPVEQ